jgi:presequence protease
VLSSLMNGTKLLEEVREKGGAYGAGSSISLNGVLSLHSYNDPHSLKTYDAFERAVKWAADGKFTQEDIDQAKILMFSKEDQVVPPHERGLKQILFGISDEKRQQNRSRALSVSKDDLIEVANSYLLSQMKEGHSTQTIFGPNDANLDVFMARGWRVEVPVQGLSVQEKNYTDESEESAELSLLELS